MFRVPSAGFTARGDGVFAHNPAIAAHCGSLTTTCSLKHFPGSSISICLGRMKAGCPVGIIAFIHPLAVFPFEYRSVVLVWHSIVLLFLLDASCLTRRPPPRCTAKGQLLMTSRSESLFSCDEVQETLPDAELWRCLFLRSFWIWRLLNGNQLFIPGSVELPFGLSVTLDLRFDPAI